MSALDPAERRAGMVEVIPTMGTVISLDVRSETSQACFGEAAREVADRLRDIDKLFSAWQSDSWVSRLIDERVCVTDCPSEVQHVIGLAKDAMELTGGYFSPFWRGSVGTGRGPDPTGLVKGWAAQQASAILLTHGMPDHVVNAAGDVVLSGAASVAGPDRTWKIGISGTPGTDGLVGVIELDASTSRWAVATSGTAERGDHIVDPHIGTAGAGIRTATAVARLDDLREAGAIADACATALVAAGREAVSLMSRLARRRVISLAAGADGIVHDPHALLTSSSGDSGR